MPESSTSFNWPRFIASAYGPTFLSSIGYGAVLPLVALTALHLGASVAMSALLMGILGVGQLVADLPASWVATKLGERKAIAVACVWDAVWLFVAFQASSFIVLTGAVFCLGLSAAIFGLARQSYVTEAVPLNFRARALSSLGGVFRIGAFVGPLVGAAIVAQWNLQAAYAFASLMCLFAAVVTMFLPELPQDVRTRQAGPSGGPKLFTILRANLRVLATLGLGAMSIHIVRSVRQTVVPLWCASLGLDPSQTSLIYAISMGVDMSLFFLGGLIMDRFGRMWVAVPSMIVLGVGLACLALTQSAVGVIIVAIILGFGNGIGAGIVMTLGSDASPDFGRAQFLSGWRLVGDCGQSVGPLLLSGITTLFSLTVATVGLGGLALVGAGWLGYWIHHSVIGQVHKH
ncbi:MAG: MFS transporter [Propionibacteriaceae bacterium]|jgi:MFS family permease|nr:MFS transporter [Propionibacteriaceae bacterium]